MRVYVPTTLNHLATAHREGTLGEQGIAAHAVTPAIREWYIEGDVEELEYTAMTEAAEASLRLLATDRSAPRRRVVLAAEVPDSAVVPLGGAPGGAPMPVASGWAAAGPVAFRSAVAVAGPLALSAVVSVHIDEPDAEPTLVAAVAAIPAADEGDDDAQFLLDEAEACDLLWYDVTEIGDLLDHDRTV